MLASVESISWLRITLVVALVSWPILGCSSPDNPDGLGVAGGSSNGDAGGSGSANNPTSGAGGSEGTTSGGASGSTGNGGDTGTAAGAGGNGLAGSDGSMGGGGSSGVGGRGGSTGSGGSSGAGGSSGSGGSAGGTGGGTGISTQGITCIPQTWDATPIGWATVSGGTTGGGTANPTMVTTLAQLNSALAGSGPAVVHLSGKVSGVVKVGSNKTLLGLCGAQIDGSVDLTGSSNVVMRNLKIVGMNCTDSPRDCSAGSDAVHVESKAEHLWLDHLDISDGSDGNLDITHACDFITISWTKFHYSTMRSDPVAGATGHRFCNLIGHDDANGSEDTGHLNVTMHHVWWADNIDQRMPRVRFGKVHVFNSLYTATGDTACIELGVNANIRSENNVFQGVKNAVDNSHANGASIIQSTGNLGSSTNIGGAAFTPTYAYTADPVDGVASAVAAGAGPM